LRSSDRSFRDDWNATPAAVVQRIPLHMKSWMKYVVWRKCGAAALLDFTGNIVDV
jgi:hypothetical protein